MTQPTTPNTDDIFRRIVKNSGAIERDIIGKFVVFFPGSLGTNTHHYFDDMKSAQDYCNQVTHRTAIGYVIQDRVLQPRTNKANTKLASIIRDDNHNE